MQDNSAPASRIDQFQAESGPMDKEIPVSKKEEAEPFIKIPDQK